MFRALIDRLGWGIAGAATLTLVLVLAGAVSAGPLDPSGPPSTSSGVFGSGTPISSLPYTISAPGSYYVTGNLTGTNTHGIIIASHNVTLDLRGFTLQGIPNSGDGVRLAAGTTWRNITVRNGNARGWSGSGFLLTTMSGGVFDGLSAEGNTGFGIVVANGASLSNCSASHNGATGIDASRSTVSNCVALANGNHGIRANSSVVTDCVASDNTLSGIDANYARIDGCTASNNLALGIDADSSEVTGNKVMYSSSTGIEVIGAGSLIARNSVHGNSQFGTGYGINVTGTVSRIEDNNVTDDSGSAQDVGIRVIGGENVVIGNSAHDNITNYDLSGPGGTYGPLATAAAATNPFTNIDY
jgi:hypothetical protein